ncbi:uncharacterized protein DUF4263 [Anseongella ginsenosidimutans]|uniref:Uncharacterized protein DUF4263 n=1 Tax=Anseongella ginsenosidimutans TaxID=496056 RepID=A0A4R3KL87_9SPHI|nr:Shedu immune nuclease family protein [Anseongella ginsenosidimutans]QEC51971.1 DUF4263 domain-containing protein [Anseongella ginsenosidimutans]TCS84760.1 uncharacterized protein DUF4263 [Anseongella ginsenosidimutans]
MPNVKEERMVKETTTLTHYDYIDSELGIKQRSKTIYKKKDLVIHYPRGFEGGQKYKTIKKFSFLGFKNRLPVGVNKSVKNGYGFTKRLNPFSKYLDASFDFKEVFIEKDGEIKMDILAKVLYLNQESLKKLNDSLDSVFKKNKDEVNTVLINVLSSLFPLDIEKPEASYIPNTIATSLLSWGKSLDEFSSRDKDAIIELFKTLSLKTDFLTVESLAKTKELVDNKYIQGTLKEYKELMKLSTDGSSLEKKWQNFLKLHNWIFSSIFAQPVILYRDEAYVGGKTLDNKNGKHNDFLIKNSLSDNVSFLEIKTHRTKLLEKSAYRGDDVFSATKDVTGSINQVLNQRDSFQKEFYSIKVKTKQEFETFNSKCVVLIGCIQELSEKQRYSFELYRSNSRDVEIITFDELQTKIESLQALMKK